MSNYKVFTPTTDYKGEINSISLKEFTYTQLEWIKKQGRYYQFNKVDSPVSSAPQYYTMDFDCSKELFLITNASLSAKLTAGTRVELGEGSGTKPSKRFNSQIFLGYSNGGYFQDNISLITPIIIGSDRVYYYSPSVITSEVSLILTGYVIPLHIFEQY